MQWAGQHSTCRNAGDMCQDTGQSSRLICRPPRQQLVRRESPPSLLAGTFRTNRSYSSSRRCPQLANCPSCFQPILPPIQLTLPCPCSRTFENSLLLTKLSSNSSAHTFMHYPLFLPNSCHPSSCFHSFSKYFTERRQCGIAKKKSFICQDRISHAEMLFQRRHFGGIK